ncbi:hypothetical protein [Brevundimonas sp.]|uniref:hypothetical protein n=1 Tax=Brevundimonas sp. TaxID=1871086 RepID=UPI0028A9BDF9|nr:hypothetical protein [Brevundimonas sp.]
MTAPETRSAWQIEQAKKCGCRGSDEYCPCQNTNSTTPARAEAPSDDLRTACKAVLDDYQTSDAHHPDHVLIRRTDFDRIKALVEAPVVARAEAQDEGAAGKREQAIKELIAGYAVMHEVICFMAGTSGAAGRWYYEKANAAFEKVKPLHVFGNDLATHPSPTPAADADRVRIAVEALERYAEQGYVGAQAALDKIGAPK